MLQTAQFSVKSTFKCSAGSALECSDGEVRGTCSPLLLLRSCIHSLQFGPWGERGEGEAGWEKERRMEREMMGLVFVVIIVVVTRRSAGAGLSTQPFP